MKMKDFVSFAEKRRKERFLHEAAIEDLQKEGCNHEVVVALEGLLKKGLVEVVRMESGEFFFRPTETGKEVLEKHDNK